ncbi:MAG: hypothetical protein CMK59_13395, partial [Proteobacteria bacterium]|nr:hypothetical protein [Pseudomonadota bacterium]
MVDLGRSSLTHLLLNLPLKTEYTRTKDSIMLSIFMLTDAFAVPHQLSQQGRIVLTDGAPVEGLENLTVRFFPSGSSSDVLWEETTTVLFTNGYYVLTLGSDPNNLLDDSLLESYPLYMELELNTDGPFTPRQPIQSAPYARIAEQAENLTGGTVNATQISIGETLIIDGNGSWVGPTVSTSWTDISGIPADLQDGDDDTLSALSCGIGEIASWGGSSWICSSDSTLTEADILLAVTSSSIDLAFGSKVNGSDILTTTDTLSVSWNELTDIPTDLADGDEVLLS